MIVVGRWTLSWHPNWNGWGLGIVADHGMQPQHAIVDATAPFVPPGPRGPLRVRVYVGPRVLVLCQAEA